jgi:hypothetical protein
MDITRFGAYGLAQHGIHHLNDGLTGGQHAQIIE